jgi:mannose-6-phosphate isomerase-like protein (cupin superfamily)
MVAQPGRLGQVWYSTAMQYIFPEPDTYDFKDLNGHDGKVFGTSSPATEHLIIECSEALTVSLVQHEVEFNYYILKGDGYFVFNSEKQPVKPGDLIVIPPGTQYSFGGRLKMLLINTPHWSEEQQTIVQA